MRFRFRVTLLTILLGLLALTMSIVGLSSYVSTRAVVNDLSSQILRQTAQRIDRRIESLLDMAADQGRLTRELLRIGQLRATDFRQLVAQWVEVLQVHPELTNLYLTLEADGTTLIVMGGPERRPVVQEIRRNPQTGKVELRAYQPQDYPHKDYHFEPDRKDLEQRTWDWYLEARQAGPGRGIWTEAYVFFNDVGTMVAPGVSYATGVYRPDGSLEGVVGVDFDFDELCHYLRKLEVSPHGFAFLVERRRDGRPRVIAHPDGQKILRPAAGKTGKELVPAEEIDDPLVRAFMAQLPASLAMEDYASLQPVHFREAGVAYLGGYRRIGNPHSDEPRPPDHPQWLICTVLPENDVLGEVHRNLFVNALIGLGSFLLAVALGVWVSGQVARPLERLAHEAEAIGQLQIQARPPLSSVVLEVDRLATATEEMKAGLRSFQKYVPADLVRSLLASGQEARLGGDNRIVTISFCDIAQFTSISEGLAPAQLVAHLGEYLEALSREVVASGGTVDKYIGDAIMAFWGAPELNPQHALAACTAAVRSQHQLHALRTKWEAEGKPLFFARFGLHTGEVVVGNIGSEARMNYTVIGDAVNLASRLEGLNKYYGTDILISEDTYQQAQPAVVARPLDWVAVKGKTQAVLVYELLGLRGEVDPAEEELAALYAQALTRYRQRDWPGAAQLLERVLQLRPLDGPARQLRARCTTYQDRPPAEDWDGVYRLESK